LSTFTAFSGSVAGGKVETKRLPQIPGISHFFDFMHEHGELFAWKHHNIGAGIKIPDVQWKSKYNRATFQQGNVAGCTSGSACWHSIAGRKEPAASHSLEEPLDGDMEIQSNVAEQSVVYPCTKDGCSHTFTSQAALREHVDVEGHDMHSTKMTLRDYVIQSYVQCLEKVRTSPKIPVLLQTMETFVAGPNNCPEELETGWALKQRKECKRFTKRQRGYLEKIFNYGATSGNKLDGGRVAKMMRTAETEDGRPLFDHTEYLEADQIMGFFSRTNAKRKKMIPSTDAADADADRYRRRRSLSDQEDDDEEIGEGSGDDCDDDYMYDREDMFSTDEDNIRQEIIKRVKQIKLENEDEDDDVMDTF